MGISNGECKMKHLGIGLVLVPMIAATVAIYVAVWILVAVPILTVLSKVNKIDPAGDLDQ